MIVIVIVIVIVNLNLIVNLILMAGQGRTGNLSRIEGPTERGGCWMLSRRLFDGGLVVWFVFVCVVC